MFSSMSFSAETQTLGCSVLWGYSGVLKSMVPKSGCGKRTTNFLAQSHKSGMCSLTFSSAQFSVCPKLYRSSRYDSLLRSPQALFKRASGENSFKEKLHFGHTIILEYYEANCLCIKKLAVVFLHLFKS